jgi:hypothetical protein
MGAGTSSEGDQPRPDDQRLSDRGIGDGLGVGDGAVLDEVYPADHREPLEAFAHTGDVEPGIEETGGLGALTGRNDDEHGHSLPWMTTKPPRACGQSIGRILVTTLQRGARCLGAAQDQG